MYADTLILKEAWRWWDAPCVACSRRYSWAGIILTVGRALRWRINPFSMKGRCWFIPWALITPLMILHEEAVFLGCIQIAKLLQRWSVFTTLLHSYLDMPSFLHYWSVPSSLHPCLLTLILLPSIGSSFHLCFSLPVSHHSIPVSVRWLPEPSFHPSFHPCVVCFPSSECGSFSPPTTVILLILLCFEGLLFFFFTAVMFGTQIHSICTDETVSCTLIPHCWYRLHVWRYILSRPFGFHSVACMLQRDEI